jgi:crotonobetainyl-CoA:carnitine CoA-transferase CaiB-like acyl-CoA transferase
MNAMTAQATAPREVRAERRNADGASGPLAGIRVLDLGTVYAAPITAMLLGDYGADVLKVEHPRGDPARTHGHTKDGHGLWWKVIARNKRTATLNIGHPHGQEILLRLVEDADVLIENFRPGVMEGWNVGPERLLEVNPRLVMLRVTGFGQFGPYAKRRAFGTLAEAMSGFAHQTGRRMDHPPCRLSASRTASPRSPGRSP